jgi:hypothetical protein
MFRVWDSFRARSSAVAAIRPFVDRTRLQTEIPDSLWLAPYFVGFLGTLITLLAARSVGDLDTDDLAAVQSKSWAVITGMNAAVIGDEICALSTAGEAHFTVGCRNACAVFEGLQTAEPGYALGEDEGAAIASALWAQHFDARVVEYLSANSS